MKATKPHNLAGSKCKLVITAGVVAGLFLLPTIFSVFLSCVGLTGQAANAERNTLQVVGQPTPAKPTPTFNPTEVKPTKHFVPRAQFEGKASYYSVAGCLGCSATLTMANGQKLDDSKHTLAMNQIKLNTRVLITNQRTGKSVAAIVTDRGGFEKYGRIADVSLAVKQAIDLKTDTDIITIQVIDGTI